MTFLTIAETATKMRTSNQRVRFLVKTDKSFPSIRHGKKSTRIVAEGLEKWIKKELFNKEVEA